MVDSAALCRERVALQIQHRQRYKVRRSTRRNQPVIGEVVVPQVECGQVPESEVGGDPDLLADDGVSAKDPLRMAWAMRYATDAGRLAYLAGRIPKRLYANASSPTEGC